MPFNMNGGAPCNAPKPACGLPQGAEVLRRHTPSPQPCPEETCPSDYVVMPYIPPCCLPAPPMFAGILQDAGCAPHPVCEVSIPHAVPCPPKVTGWGAYDGGLKHWLQHACEDQCYPGLFQPESLEPRYAQQIWESFMDMNTGDELWGSLPYYRGHQMAHMTPTTFISLAHKIAQLQHMYGLIVHPTEVPMSSAMGVQFVSTGTDANGKPTYGFGLTYEGAPVGTPFALVTERNAAGVITGVRLPFEVLAAAEAAAAS